MTNKIFIQRMGDMYKKLVRSKELKKQRDTAETLYEMARKAGDSQTTEEASNLALSIDDNLNSIIADLHFGVCQLLEQYFAKPTPTGTNPPA